MRTVSSACIFCGCGCKIKYQVENGRVTGARPDSDDHVSEGKPCIKGLAGWESFANDRLTKPLLRTEKQADFKEVSWPEAYAYIKEQVSKVEPEKVVVTGSGNLSNEDNYLISKFARSVLQTNNVDTSARLCHAATVVAAQNLFGVAAMPDYIDDLKKADFILTIGTNPAGNYPVAFNKMKEALSKGCQMVSLDVEPSETLNHASVPIIIEYQGLTAFMGGLLHSWFQDVSRSKPGFGNSLKPGFRSQSLALSVERFDPEFVAEFCGIEETELREAYQLLKKAKDRVVMFGMGLTQHADGTENATTAMTLAEVIGAKIIPMRGKINIQGSGDVGGRPNFVPFDSDVDLISQYWGRDPRDNKDGLGLVRSFLMEQSFGDTVGAFLIFEMNPAQSLADLEDVHRTLTDSFVVYAHHHPSKTMEFADVVLPLAGFVETGGTYTNAERQVRSITPVTEPLGESKPAWEIMRDLAGVWGREAYFQHQTAQDVFAEIKEAVPAYEKTTFEGEEYADKQKKFVKLAPIRHLYPKNPPPEEYPVVLTTARSRYHFCTGEASRRCPTLMKQLDQAYCHLSGKEAAKWGIGEGDQVKVTSPEGSIELPAKLESDMPENLIMIPFHFEDVLVNLLASAKPRQDVDAESGTPNYKAIFVRIEKA